MGGVVPRSALLESTLARRISPSGVRARQSVNVPPVSIQIDHGWSAMAAMIEHQADQSSTSSGMSKIRMLLPPLRNN